MESFPKGNSESRIEKIRCAALEYKGEIFEGPSHVDAYYKLQEKYPELKWEEAGSYDYRDGFVTTHGRFVLRPEAAQIASAADQIEEGDKGDKWLSAEWLKENKGKSKFPRS